MTTTPNSSPTLTIGRSGKRERTSSGRAEVAMSMSSGGNPTSLPQPCISPSRTTPPINTASCPASRNRRRIVRANGCAPNTAFTSIRSGPANFEDSLVLDAPVMVCLSGRG